jgi:DNA (cytosine-5)-methyltransferase 1
MKLGGLFSGVGGFELAWTQLGHEVAWMCEIDKSARKVLEQRFPGVPIYEDVEQLDPAEVEAVDVLTGGSPCQGFSVAGMRSGLEHGESRLFADYIRIMDGLAERGLRWALWENVPGVLSIQNDDGERTFEHVVTALVGGTVPVRLGQGRWNTGLADGGGRAVAWRVLDSRYFGVAQRRRRVFACVAFGDSAADRAGRALLAKPESVSRDTQASDAEGEGVAGGVADCVGSTFTLSGHGAYVEGVGTLRAAGGDLGGGSETLATQVRRPSYGMIGASGSEGATFEEQPSLTASHGQPGNVAQAFNWQSGGDARGLDLTDEPSALTTQQTPAVLISQSFDEMNFTTDPDTHHVLRAGTPQSTGAVTEYGVRRLTPVECERLQAFPDGWTEPAGSDSARYKALGNAVTVNTVRWVLGRMLEQS